MYLLQHDMNDKLKYPHGHGWKYRNCTDFFNIIDSWIENISLWMIDIDSNYLHSHMIFSHAT